MITRVSTPAIALTPVQSSNIEAVGYDPATQTQRVRFKDGAEYDYHGVPEERHHAMMKAESIGGHHAIYIKARHKATKR